MQLPIVGRSSVGAPPPLILGIDLGTTFSLAAVMTPQGPALIRDETGASQVPSCIGFEPNGRVAVGQAARSHRVTDPRHTIFSVKRLIGRTMADLQADLPHVPYQVVEREIVADRKVLHVRIDDHEHTPEELSAMILREVVARAERQLNRKVEKAVITVPAYFDESQRQATRDAGRMAGLDVVRIVNEPTAAALAYGMAERRDGSIAVYDFGGGTFDCSILQVKSGVFKVLSTHGDTHLGGDDIDLALVQRFSSLMDPTDTLEDRQALRDACERLKIELSERESARVTFERSRNRELAVELSRAAFNELISPLVERTLASCRAALKDARLDPLAIDDVVLVGGSSRIPLVFQSVQKLFGRTPRMEINPDEVVAMGAAVQASILAGEQRQLLLLDITPLSLGIETMGGAVSKLIPRNSTIPAQATERFTTFVDNQTGVEIHVVQGERELARDCRSLGQFKLSGLPPMPAGLPRIDVTFTLDANGMLQVSARETHSNQIASIEVRPSHGLAREDVERMIKESVAQAKADFNQRRLIELRNKSETNLRATAKGLDQAGSLLGEEARSAIENARRDLEAARQGDDVDRLQHALDAFDGATQPLAELIMNNVLEQKVAGKRLSSF